MNNSYDLIFVYKYFNSFELNKVLLSKNGIIQNGEFKNRKLNEIYNEITNGIIPFNSKRKGIYLKKTVTKEEIEEKNINIDEYICRFDILDIDIKTLNMDVRQVSEDKTETEKQDTTTLLLTPIYELFKEHKIVTFKEMRKEVLKRENMRLVELKNQTEEVLESIRKNGTSYEYEQELKKIETEIDSKEKEINRLLKQYK